MKLSQKRQRELLTPETLAEVRVLYQAACERFGEEKVRKSHNYVWDLRCMWGMTNRLPFGATRFTNLSELLWLLEQAKV